MQMDDVNESEINPDHIELINDYFSKNIGLFDTDARRVFFIISNAGEIRKKKLMEICQALNITADVVSLLWQAGIITQTEEIKTSILCFKVNEAI